jgi:hypothetical protein
MFYKSSIPWKIVPLYSARASATIFASTQGDFYWSPSHSPMASYAWNLDTLGSSYNKKSKSNWSQVCVHHTARKHSSYHSN